MQQKTFFLVALAALIVLAAASSALATPSVVEYRLTVTKDGKPVNASISVYTVKDFIRKNELVAAGNIVNGSFKFNYTYPNETVRLLFEINLEGKEYRVYRSYKSDMVKTETLTVNVTNADNTTSTENITIYYIEDSVSLGTTARVFGWVAARAMLLLVGALVIIIVLLFTGGKKRRGLLAAAATPIANLAGFQIGPVSVSTSGVVFAGLGGLFTLVLLLVLVYLAGKKNVFKV